MIPADFLALAEACAPNVAPVTLAAIVRTESGFNPLAINVNGKGGQLPRQPSTRREAVGTAKALIAAGYSIDVGLAQINSANLAPLGLSVEDAFDPCRNLAGAARILTSNYRSARASASSEQEALQGALSAYNTGSYDRGFANGYVRRVLDNAVVTVPAIEQRALLRAVPREPAARQLQRNPPVQGRTVRPPEAASPRSVDADVYGERATSPVGTLVY